MCYIEPEWFFFLFISIFLFNFRVHDSDNESSDLEKRNRRDRDGESSKTKKKHKKHKKNKKSKKHDVDGKERISSKKHKKHHKKSRSSEEFSSDSNNSGIIKTRIEPTVSINRNDTEIKLTPQTTSTLNTKFTEIMKSNGHIVVAKAPITKYNNENGADASGKLRDLTTKIPTDPNKLVEFITKSLDPNTSTQVVSSASDSDTVRDVDSPDVAVIEEEDDLNLEELMRQKALLQARLGGIVMSDTESEASHRTPPSIGNNKLILNDNKTNDKTIILKRSADTVNNDVILLDDSSNDASNDKPLLPPKKKIRNSRSRSKERVQKERNTGNSRNNRDNRDIREIDKSTKNRRSDLENRYKEDLRKEIDRDKERNRTSPKRSNSKPRTYSPSRPRTSINDKSKTQSTTSLRERDVSLFSFLHNIFIDTFEFSFDFFFKQF